MDDNGGQGVLDWARAMLVADSLREFARVAAGRTTTPGDTAPAALVLADPGHELRHLMHGETQPATGGFAPLFVDSLVGVAPQCAALHAPWCGEYRAADHSLLLPESAQLDQILMLPLRCRSQLVGVYCAGGRDGPPSLARLGPAWLEHVAAVMSATLERLFDRARLLRTGITDPLTGWHTRRYLLARLGEELARSLRHGTAASCLLIDVDRLRLVNERHGVPAGDRALVELGGRIEAQVRSSDTLAHLGDDCFAVLLPGTAAAQARSLAVRIRAAVRAAPVEVATERAEAMTVTIGIADAPPGETDDRKAAADQWLAEAEAALHRAKRRGGDCCEISSVAATSAAGKSARRPRR